MFGITSYDGKLDIGYFYADTIAELSNLPNLTANGKGNLYTINAVGVGSKCDCYEDKNIYILKGDNTWQIYKPIASEGGGGGSITVDSELSTSSTNPVQNKVITTTLNGKVDTTSVGSASGIAELDANGKVPASQLPSYVDDVVEGYYKEADGKFYEEDTYETEITGEAGKIYISVDTSIQYRWTGSAFSALGGALVLGETSTTAYRGDRGKEAYDHANESGRAINYNRGFYKFGTTAQGHVKSIQSVSQSDITALGIATDALASISEKGLMSANDKMKLDSVDNNANANVQVDWNEANSGDDAYIKNKPSLATVATSGSYADLNNTPTLGTASAKDFTTSVTNGSTDVITSGGVYAKLANDYYDKADVQSLIAGGVKYAGAVAFANLPSPSAATEYNFYFVTDAFTTTSDFVIGPGINIPANSCFIVLNIGTAQSPVYKYDDFNGYINISGKQDTLTAGTNITIDSNNVISATDTTYSSLPAASSGTAVSLVTTGEKYNWNGKLSKWTYLGDTDADAAIQLPAQFDELFAASTLNAWNNVNFSIPSAVLHSSSAITDPDVAGGYIYKTGDYTSQGDRNRYADCLSFLINRTAAKLYKWEHNENSSTASDFTSYAKTYWYYR